MDAFHKWLSDCNALPKSALGTATSYTLNLWKYITNFLFDGICELSNNRAERSAKPFVIGRRNFLFCDTVRGAESSAIIYSIVERAKENGLKPMNYLTYVFEKMPNIDFKNNPELLKELTPWSKSLPKECYLGKED